MVPRLAAGAVLAALLAASAHANAPAVVPLVSHRAAYELSLADPTSPPPSSAKTPVAATGLIAYEFRGSACEGYSSSFRQMTEMDRDEGEPLSMKVDATSFEDADGKSMRFRVVSDGPQNAAPVAGVATRGADDDLRVDLTKPEAKSIHFGHDVLFPTQHVERLIGAARSGARVVQARVYDGSDTGAKIYSTLTIIAKEAKTGDDDTVASELKGVRRWPVVVSYFNEASKDTAPEYTLSFQLYENGVSGSLKLDYGSFALNARLRKLEILPTSVCSK